MSSFDVIRRLRKILNTKKMGHTGTLDPLASGLILIATEKSTKLIHELENAKKRYRFTVRIDGTTDSLDLGTPLRQVDTTGYRTRTPDELREFILSQTSQIPPKYSALHIGGKRAYDLAREGIDFELQERAIVLEDVILENSPFPMEITLSLTLSSGGYVRSLAPIIAGFFGIDGGYITELRRTHIYLGTGVILSLDGANSLESIIPIPYDRIFPTIHTIQITYLQFIDITNGKVLSGLEPHQYGPGRYFLDFEGKFLSLCSFDGEKYTIIRNDI